jgi:hypothetical protein
MVERFRLTESALPRSPELTAVLFVAVPVALGVLTLLLGWTRADRYPYPQQWRAGIALDRPHTAEALLA